MASFRFSREAIRHSRPARRLGRRIRESVVCAIAVAVPLIAAGCWTYDESAGTFTLTATGGLEVSMHGRVEAYHTPSLSDDGPMYLIVLDVDSASPPLDGFSALVIVTAKHPTGPRRFIDVTTTKPTSPSDARATASVGLQVPSGAVSEWDTDSATVDFKPVRGRHAVAGDFVLWVNCSHCSPPKKGLHAVLHGSFETQD